MNIGINNSNFKKEFIIHGKVSWENYKNYFHELLHDPNKQDYAVFLNDLHFGYCAFCYINNSEQIDKLLIYL